MTDDLIAKYKLTQKQFQLAGRIIKLYQTECIDAVIDSISNEEYTQDERFPFFLNIWDSGIYLAEYILSNTMIFKNKTVLELGSGTGIAGIAAGLCSAQVIFSDYEEEALRLSRINAEFNHIEQFDTLLADWRNFPDLKQTIDIIIGADLLYENRQVEALLKTLSTQIRKSTICLLSDPSRDYLPIFLKKLEELKLKTILEKEIPNPVTPLRNVRIYQISGTV